VGPSRPILILTWCEFLTDEPCDMSPISVVPQWCKTSILSALIFIGVVCKTDAANERFPVLQAGGVSYSNVLVTGTSTRDVFIRHSGGMATLRVSDLDAATRSALGLPASAPTPPTAAESATNRIQGWLGKLAEIRRQKARPTDQTDAQEDAGPSEVFREHPTVRIFLRVTFFTAVILYFPFCFSCRRLCRRAGAPSSFLVWLPIFKRLTLFKAVNVSWLWFFFGLIIPFVGLCAWILCCLRLCETFQRTRWLALPMLFPVYGWLFFLCLDWVSRADDQDPAVQSQDRIRLAA